MKYIIIAFKNRTNLQSFTNILRQNGINISIINTPRKLSLSCGLSVKTDFRNYSKVLNIIKNLKITGFDGIFLLTQYGLREQIEKLF